MNGEFDVFEHYESNVRSYCRSFPAVFDRAKNATVYDEQGKAYIDFFAGAGALNYGHNPDFIKAKLIDFLTKDRVCHALDMYTVAKRELIERFGEVILKPRGLDYKMQFCGPTGANAVEAALKLARLCTNRTSICAFTGGWHGMSIGCLSITGNRENRQAAGFPLPFGIFLPYPEGPYQLEDTIGYIDSIFADPNSGLDTPAAIVLETIQAEGGINVAPVGWLKQIRDLCNKYGVLLIVDEVQVGCGRSGPFFSFERAGIEPDIVCLSKSIGGYGLPMSMILFKRSLDIWQPGQHTGTFRGNQLAFIASTAALDFWEDSTFQKETISKGEEIKGILSKKLSPEIPVRGLGMIWGIDLTSHGGKSAAAEVSKNCFKRGLIVERCGRDDVVLKILPPLTIERDLLRRGCEILCQALEETSVVL